MIWYVFVYQDCSILLSTWSVKIQLSISPVSQRTYSHTDSLSCGLLMSAVCLEFSCPRLSHGWLLIIKVSAQLSSAQRMIVLYNHKQSQLHPSVMLGRLEFTLLFFSYVPCIIVTCVRINTI